MPPIDPTDRGVRLTVRVQTRASTTEIIGLHGDALKIRLSAPPVDGAANAAPILFLAERLGVPRAAVHLLHGASSRRKILLVEGLGPETARRSLLIGGE